MPQHLHLEEARGIETRAPQHPNEPHINSAGGHTMMPAAASVPADMFKTDLFSSQGMAGAGREAEGGGRSETRVVSQAVPRKSPTLSQMMADSLSLANLDLEMAADKLKKNVEQVTDDLAHLREAVERMQQFSFMRANAHAVHGLQDGEKVSIPPPRAPRPAHPRPAHPRPAHPRPAHPRPAHPRR